MKPRTRRGGPRDRHGRLLRDLAAHDASRARPTRWTASSTCASRTCPRARRAPRRRPSPTRRCPYLHGRGRPRASTRRCAAHPELRARHLPLPGPLRERGARAQPSGSSGGACPGRGSSADGLDRDLPAQGRPPPSDAVKLVRSGDHVWLHAGCNNPEELLKALVGAGRRAARRRGDAPPDLRRRRPRGPAVRGLLPPPRPLHRARTCGSAVNEGRADWVPVFLSEIPGLIRSRRHAGGRGLHPHLAARRARLLLLRRRRRVHEGGRRERAGRGRARQPADAALARRLASSTSRASPTWSRSTGR